MAEDAPEKLIINGQEYSLDDVAGLVDLGNKYKEIEEKSNTPLDKVWPAYTRTTQEKTALEQQLAERTAELEKFQNPPKTESPNEELLKAREALKQIGGVDQDYLKQSGYMTKEEVEEFIKAKDLERQQVAELEREGKRLETEIDGTDGRVPFDYRSVLAYANAYRKENLIDAYNEMNQRGNAKWQQAQLAAEEAKKPTRTISVVGGRKEPSEPKVTNDNLTANLNEIAKLIVD